MLESLHIKIEMLKILQLEKERLVDIRGKLSQERITPDEEDACLNELEKASERWRQTSGQLELLPIANMTVERFSNIIQSARAQMTRKDRKITVHDIETRIREINDELCKLKYQVSVELDREQPAGQIPEARNTASKPQTPAGSTVNKPQEIYYDDREKILFADKAHAKLTHTEKVFFEYFLDKEGSVDVDSVIDHMTTLSELKGTVWDIRYFNKMKSTINKKCKVLGITTLIRNVAEKENKLSVKVKEKIFKS